MHKLVTCLRKLRRSRSKRNACSGIPNKEKWFLLSYLTIAVERPPPPFVEVKFDKNYNMHLVCLWLACKDSRLSSLPTARDVWPERRLYSQAMWLWNSLEMVLWKKLSRHIFGLSFWISTNSDQITYACPLNFFQQYKVARRKRGQYFKMFSV